MPFSLHPLPSRAVAHAAGSIALALGGLLSSAAAPAVDQAYLQAGALVRPTAHGFPDDLEAGAGWALPWQWQGGRLRSRLDTALGVTDNAGTTSWRAMAAPVLRYQPDTGSQGVFAEIGLGIAYLSNTRWGNHHDLSSHAQFEGRLGGGYRLGSDEFSLNLIHFSNGGLKQPNRGAELVGLRYTRHF